MRALHLAWTLALAGLAAGGCDDPSPTPAAPADAAVPDASPRPVGFAPLLDTLLGEPVPFLRLVDAADRAHVRREGPVLTPGGPGWERVTRLAARSPWLPATPLDDRAASWLDSIGGSLYFPVGPEGPGLSRLRVWLHPVARGQVVSLFVDEQPLSTLRLAEGGKAYTFPLPAGGLAPGEHDVRLWFRFRRPKGRGDLRTPGALGGVRLLGPETPAAPSLAWVGEMDVAGVSGRALLAGPPAGWRYYLLPPAGARLTARAAVSAGDPVDFVVRATVDDEPPRELLRVQVSRGSVAELQVDLGAYADRPVALSLDAEGSTRALEHAAWIEPVILMPGLPRTRPAPVRNVVIWTVDGLRADRVGLGRGGDRAATPNLDLLAAEGAAAVDVWAGGATPQDGHGRLLAPQPGATLADLAVAAGRRAGLLAASGGIEADWAQGFTTRLDLRRLGDRADTRSLLAELDDWLDVRKREPFVLYIATDDPLVALDPPPGYEAAYRRSRPVEAPNEQTPERARRDRLAAYDARVSVADYWIGQLMAVLGSHGVLEDTAVIIVGTVGDDLEAARGELLTPDRLQVPLVIWHPGLRRTGEPRPLVHGGDLHDVATTVLGLLGAPAGPGQDLLPALFFGRPLSPEPSAAVAGNQVAARYGRWLLRGLGARELRLWNLADDPTAADELSGRRPIALRVLRDSLLDRP
ncbi:MAG: sulfatase-like hydrolase/transferase [Myxococcales bacterium]|nr:sulfatase-like hydrolase/transferase [Myxococcales bacterium]